MSQSLRFSHDDAWQWSFCKRVEYLSKLALDSQIFGPHRQHLKQKHVRLLPAFLFLFLFLFIVPIASIKYADAMIPFVTPP